MVFNLVAFRREPVGGKELLMQVFER